MKALSFVNLAGVLALGVLCVAQWNNGRILDGEIGRLEALRNDQERELENRVKTIDGMRGDMDELRDRILALDDTLRSTQADLSVEKEKCRMLEGENSQLRDSVSRWVEAVNERDKRIAEDNSRIRDLADSINDTVAKHNELADGYRNLVDTLNQRTLDYNELAERYKALTERK